MASVSKRWSAFVWLAVVVAFALHGPVTAAPGGKIDMPDFTKGDKLPEGATHDWNLGATGLRGWMYSDRLTTTDARQVYITKVVKGSPADGIIEVGDVVLGVGGKVFSYDPRTEIGKALTAAESEAGRGRLTLLRWRDGRSQTVALRLPVLGSYSATAPYACQKSKRVLEQGCEALAAEMADPRYRLNPIPRCLNALALLASGEKKYLPLVKREAQWASEFRAEGFATWYYGYALMLVSEYTMATGDRSLMPGLERLAVEAAEGQSVVGSWGHKFAGDHGLLVGYGMMNAPGLTLTTGLVLAREAGVKDPRVGVAIDKSVRLLRFYVGKGSIPYGDHDPWIQTHDDNGKNGIAAVLFNLLGDDEAAEYFSRMSVASHGAERDCGHTGNFLNMLWALPGVNVSGPNATGAWMNEFGGWYLDLAREHDGTLIHQGPPQVTPDSYRGWDSSGAFLLAYAMPLKTLRLTGKGEAAVPQLSRAQAERLIDDGRGWDNKDRNSFYDGLTTAQLMDRLGSWSPIVRERAGAALSRRKAEVVPQLLTMLDGKELEARYGACQALKQLRVDRAAAVPALIKTLEAEDLWLRILSAEALAGIGEPAKQAVPVMLRRLAMTDRDKDPRLMEQRYLCFALFNTRGGLLGRSVQGIDHALLLDAVRAGLRNDDGRARGALASVYRHLSLEQIRPLLPAIHEAVVETAPSGMMFADGVRLEGLRVLARHHVDEGIDAAITYLNNQNPWGEQKRTPDILKSLVSYGAHAQRVIPQLERLAERYAEEDAKRRERARNHLDKAVLDAIAKIKASNERPELIRIGQGRVGDQPAIRVD